jgi:hypothetical protein
MKTVKTYMVRKPSDLDEVKSITRANSDRLETVAVVETIILSLAEYKKICQNPLNDYDFLEGKGGYCDEHDYRQVVELKAEGQPTLYADPSGSSYCRYLGVEIK